MKRSSYLFAFAASLCFSSVTNAWQTKMDFENGSAGAKTVGTDAFTSTTAAVYSTAQVYSGKYSSANSISQGEYGFGIFGGISEFPTKVGKGGEIWVRLRAYFPTGFDFTANPWLKFIRIHTQTPSGSNIGYDDWYINISNTTNPYRFIYEGEQVWYPFASTAQAPQLGKWETYEMYVKLDTVPASQGGQAVVRMWKNGVLIGESKDRVTLANADAVSNAVYIFTYWNGAAPKTQTMYLDDVVVQTDTPSAKDAAGNAFIGVGTASAVTSSNPPSAPVLQVK